MMVSSSSSSSCHDNPFIRTQSSPPNTIFAPAPRAASLFPFSNLQKCNHCMIIENYKNQARAIINCLIESCQELTNVICSRFHEDVCVCYPNTVENRDLENIDEGFYSIHLPSSFKLEFIQHILRLVRPAASEQERTACNSRFVRHIATSKILVPILMHRETGVVVQIGFPKCYGLLKQDDTSDFRFVDVVIDYEPPKNCVNSNKGSSSILFCSSATGAGAKKQQQNVLYYPSNFFNTATSTDQIVSEDLPTSSSYQKTSLQKQNNNNYYSVLNTNSLCGERSLKDFYLNYYTMFSCDCIQQFQQRQGSLKKYIVSGQYSTKGRRQIMEDRIVSIEDLHAHCGLPPLPDGKKVAFFAVYDGHGGNDVVDFVSSQFHYLFCQTSEYASGDYVSALYATFDRLERQLLSRLSRLRFLNNVYLHYVKHCKILINKTTSTHQNKMTTNFLTKLRTPTCVAKRNMMCEEESFVGDDELTKKIKFLEEQILDFQEQELCLNDCLCQETENEENNEDMYLSSGSTALIIVVINTQLYVANLGDSRCILSRGGKISCLTEDHRLQSNTREYERVQKTPGTFSYDGYLCGQLGVSRAFGNLHNKMGKKLLGLSSCPDIIYLELQPEDEFIVAGSDGVFDTIAATDAAFIVHRVLTSFKDPTVACKELVELALIHHSEDNISAIIIWFTTEKSPSLTSNNIFMTHQPRSISTSIFLKLGEIETTQGRISNRLTKSDPSIVNQQYSLDYHVQQQSSNCSASASNHCEQCTCKDLKLEDAKESPTDHETISSRQPGVRKRYCWNIVQTP